MSSKRPGESEGGTPEALPSAQVNFTPSAVLFPFASKWFESSVGRIHYVDEGSGRPLLLLHGQPDWSFLYRHLIKLLQGKFRCIAPDYPGFGLSVRPDGYRYTPEEHSTVMSELVEHLDLRDMIVMGQDWGGPIATGVALNAPERVTGVVFGNTWCWPADFRTSIFSWIMSTWPVQWLIKHRNLFVKRLMPMMLKRSLTVEEFGHYLMAQPTAESRPGVAEFPRQIRKSKRWLAGLVARVPSELGSKRALLVWGMRDIFFVPKRYLPTWRDLYPDHEVVELPTAGHYIQEDAPEEVADAVIRRFA